MDESGLKALIQSLEAQRDSLDLWMHFCTGVVAVGVLLEIAFIIREYRHEWKAWKVDICRAEKPSRPWFFIQLAVTFLIAGGIAGELSVSVNSGRLETKIRQANKNLVLLLERELVAVEKRQRPRALDQAKFAQALEGKPKKKIELLFVSDFEAHMFSGFIFDSLSRAGWEISVPTLAPLAKNGVPYQAGVTIVAKAVSSDLKPEDKEAMEALEMAFLRSSGPALVLVTPRQDSTLPDGVFRVIVGQKQ